MRIGSIFSGIGGIELGLERAGLGATVFHAETDPYCARVLERHWPGVPNLGDVRNVGSNAPAIDLLAGGFPCQNISSLGRKEGIRGSKSGLWSEFARIVGELRPAFVVVENVPSLRSRGLDVVLGDLSSLGYDAEWATISAREIGAPIRGQGRSRVFIVAYPNGWRCGREGLSREAGGEILAGVTWGDLSISRLPGSASDHWAREPDVGRVAHGVPHRVDRLRALGNAVVPQCAEFVGRCILRAIGEGE